MRLCLLLFLIAAVTTGRAGVAMAEAGSPEESARVDQLFANWGQPTSPGCAVAVMRDGKIIHARGYGMADLEHNVKITPVLRRFSTSRRCQSSSPSRPC